MKSGALLARPLLQLRTVPAFEGLPARQLLALAQDAEEVLLHRGTPLYETGLPARSMFLLVDGRVRLLGPQGPKTLGAGDVVGFLESLAGEPVVASAVAESDVVALRLDVDAFRDACDTHFGILAAVLGRLALLAAQDRDALQAAVGGDGRDDSEAPDRPADRVDRILALHRSPVFPSAGMDALAELAGQLVEHRLEAGRRLWPPSGGPDGAFLVSSGIIRLESDHWEGRILLGPGGVPGLVTTLVHHGVGIRATTETPVRALYVAGENLLDILEDHGDMAFAFLRRLASCVLGSGSA